MRRAARLDTNQTAIVKALQKAGLSVQSLAGLGAGVPDILVGFRGANVLMELKDGTKPPSARKLTPDQVKWHGAWQGQVIVINSVDEALEALGLKSTHTDLEGRN